MEQRQIKFTKKLLFVTMEYTKKEILPSNDDLLGIVCDEIQQDWNDLAYKKVYEEGLWKGIEIMRHESKKRLSSLPSTEERKTAEEIKPMTSDRIREIQQTTAYPESVSVMQALKQVWHECSQQTEAMAKEIESLKGQLAVSERLRLEDAASHNDEKYQDHVKIKWQRETIEGLQSELSATRERVEKLPYNEKLLIDLWHKRNPCHDLNSSSGEDMFWRTAFMVFTDYLQSLNPTKQD